ncbi:uncharacterized protein [Blastocystis hominis]|uniref:Citrate transporter-like domain-containing protein n=1 Tax=Blastocystis hominis TaxID=12968 RepID=D8M7F9_BLAHO|nr:uncharacterized protein [Blastocystis hominis]CBK23998.2 unnamed protein product [Blastocystis hominis]|eukprot:XP_012898046.1 uncharacterized protein [Blastocystis hominis]
MSDPINDSEKKAIELPTLREDDEVLPTIPEESTSSDMRSDIPVIQVTTIPKKDVDTIHIYSRASSKATSSFYGAAGRQSTILGEDPLFNDHDPVAIISASRMNTQGHTKSSYHLQKSLTTASIPAEIPGIPFVKRLTSRSSIGAFIGLLISIIVMCCPLDPTNVSVQRCAGVLLIMATLWISEIIPLSVTALLPVILFPFLNILPASTVSTQYFNDVIFLFFAGFLMSLAMEKWNLHMRIALCIMRLFTRPRSMLLGIMCTGAVLSIFVSNTAAALMMVANCNALVESLNKRFGEKKVKGFAKSIFLGIAFSTSIGGIPTLISSPPNMIFAQMFNDRFGDKPGVPVISFSNWLISTLPMSIVLLLCAWVMLFYFCPAPSQFSIDKSFCVEEYKKLGKMKYEEYVVAFGFVLLSLLWLFRVDLNFGDSFSIPGWSNLFPSTAGISDGTVGMTVALLLFFIPSRKTLRGEKVESKDEEFIMTWGTAKKLPWDLVLLFGGGFALAAGAEQSGLATWIGSKMSRLGGLNVFLTTFLIEVIMVIVGIFTSNTACASIMIPVVIGVATSSQINPLVLLFPVVCCCSCAFLLPSSTPPNLIAYTSNTFTTLDLLLSGLCLSVVCIIAFEINNFTIFPAVIGYDWRVFPEWAM